MAKQSEKYRQESNAIMKRLAEIANEKQVSIESISEQTGLNQNTIIRLFNGKYSPSLEIFLMICDSIGASIIQNKENV